MENGNTNWGQSVTAVVIKDNKVLLGRHTYGPGKGKLIVPGGYVNIGESPQQAIVREYFEETGIIIEPKDVIGIRFNSHDWYVAFTADYISGEPKSDNDENSEVIWLDADEALQREDVPELTKKLLESAINNNSSLKKTPFRSAEKNSPYSLYVK
ncbi:MAG: NUDIX domain-containing protein [Eubacterium sp.]|nr:NUDIX domain-containing protein [Eubacterium sp.]